MLKASFYALTVISRRICRAEIWQGEISWAEIWQGEISWAEINCSDFPRLFWQWQVSADCAHSFPVYILLLFVLYP